MPYPIAHPAAVIPLARLMGRFAVPSALVIGSVVPDLWYVVPGAERWHSHVVPALLWFCLPLGLLVYAAFHLLLKQPLLALLPPATAARAAACATQGLPAVPRAAVMLSLLAGASTHLAWDALTHASSTSSWLLPALDQIFVRIGRYSMNGYQVLQHSSTILGTAIVGFWTWHKLKTAPAAPRAAAQTLPPTIRAAVVAVLVAIAATAAWSAGIDAFADHFDLVALRSFARAAGFAGLSALALAVLAYCALFQLWRLRPET